MGTLGTPLTGLSLSLLAVVLLLALVSPRIL
jgi:hypothetical protein